MDFTALQTAIQAVEDAQTGLATDNVTQSAAQAKFDAAATAKAQADADAVTGLAAFNSALDGLIAAATAAKVPTVTPVPVQP
jgi:hypothetical protein